MSEGLLKLLVWMPNLPKESFWNCFDYEIGILCTLCIYSVTGQFAVIKPLFTVEYHHESDTIIAYIQFVFAYIGAFSGFFSFYLGLPMCMGYAKGEDEGPRGCNHVRNNIFSHLYIILCLILGFCEIMWATCTLVRAFTNAPGLVRTTNASTNPYPKVDVCGSKSAKSKVTCRPATDEEIRKSKQWDIDHANDTVYEKNTKIFDAVLAGVLILTHLYAFYPLIAFKSQLIAKLEDEDEEQPEGKQGSSKQAKQVKQAQKAKKVQKTDQAQKTKQAQKNEEAQKAEQA